MRTYNLLTLDTFTEMGATLARRGSACQALFSRSRISPPGRATGARVGRPHLEATFNDKTIDAPIGQVSGGRSRRGSRTGRFR
jgi:hypothetical protein